MKKSFSWLLLGLSSFLLASSAWSATVVEHRNAQGQVQQVIIDDQHARMNNEHSPSQYMLVDFAARLMYAVDIKQKTIVKISMDKPVEPSLPAGMEMPKQKPVDAQLVKKDAGIDVAGYPTTHYQVTANGKMCSDDYFSVDAYKTPHIDSFLKTMQEMSKSRKKMMSMFPMSDPCAKAHATLEPDASIMGMPMKSIGNDGEVRHEILSIKVDVPTTAETFALPTDFKTMTEQEMVQSIQGNIRKQMEKLRQGGQQPPQQGVPPAPASQPAATPAPVPVETPPAQPAQ
ncbi:hypothetical protein [Beggiatoa leptomitoformis]|uniref:DUF4412 domain-containing protein n=1 Tax=Beggiatoa leptomitoformis TaxID=288004 RepID=A0A2N9YD08_9GAMM|nr:hypothetical protein [Beggiatoa leptomitoformis]ALG69238.1 hypothetical protein AL038_18055 [Beggiatoa leptomitoformis]AUI68326.1 hypothetical protein BLE401_06160 [Beggiatoa leptomitoformis]